MRKSFLYLLMSAMVLIGMGTLNSCKDYEDDIMSQFRIDQAIQDATLRDLLAQCQTTCKTRIDSLAEVSKNCQEKCSLEHKKLDAKIDSLDKILNGRIDSTNINVESLKDSIDSINLRITALQLADNAIRSSISSLEQAYKLADNALNGRIDSLKAGLNGRIDSLADETAKDRTDINYLLGAVGGIRDTLACVVKRLGVVEGNIAKLDSKVDSLYRVVDGKIDKLNDKIDLVKNELNERIDRVYYTISEIQNTINGIQQNVLDLTKLYANLDGRLYRVELQAAEALELAKSNKAWLQALQTRYEKDSAYTKFRIDSLAGITKTAEDNLNTAIANFNDAIKALQERDDSLAQVMDSVLETKIAVLDSAYKAGDSILNDKIDTLEKRVKANEDSIKAINTKISELTSRVEKVEQSQKALVTSIELNAAINPVFGTFNLPADIRNNALIGYYGVLELSTTANFPSKAGSGFYAATRKAAADKYALTEKDWNMLGLSDGDLFKYGGSEGNILANTSDENGDSIDLGTLYVTVNPTKADFTGTTFDLVNSLDEAAPAVLSDLQPSQHKIDFGYTRAKTTGEAKNGFYEAKVSIAKDDAEAATIHTDGIESAIKQLMKKAEGATVTVDKNGVHYSNSYVLNVSDVAVSILDNLSGITDAYALRASWNDDLIGDTRSVYSQYGLAIVPLRSRFGYASFNDFNYQTIPGYEAAWSLIDKLGNAAKKAIETMVGKVQKIIEDTEIKQVSVDFNRPDDSGKYTIDMTIEVPAGTKVKAGDDGYLRIYDEDGKVLGAIPGNAKLDANGNLVFSFNSKQINLYPYMEPVFKYIEDAFLDVQEDVNKTYKDLQDLFDRVNGMLDDIKKYESKIDKATGALQNLLDAVNTRIVNFVNSANYRIQPNMIANESKGAHILSQAQSVPSEIESSTQFIVTNLVGEIISPAVKKHVACTNVFKGGVSAQDETGNFSDIQACQAEVKAINEANDMLNVVFNGDITRINVQGFKSGYTYELAFSGLDYQGLQTTRKFYVKVK